MNNTFEAILERMTGRIRDEASTMEGSFTYDNLASVASELARFYDIEAGRLIDRSHLDTAKGEDLDRLGMGEHGIARLQATYEEAAFLIQGVPGTVLSPAVGIQPVDGDIVFYIAGNYRIPDGGSIMVNAKASQPGSGKRILAGTKLKFVDKYVGLTGATIPQSSSGGYDKETDEQYYKRILESESDVAGYGNLAWYKKTAKEVPGVRAVKVIDLARGVGTVDVIIAGEGTGEVAPALIQRVKEHIESKRIVGADVQVSGANLVAISVTASIRIRESADLSLIKEQFKKALERYFLEWGFDTDNGQRVSYSKIMVLLLEVDGVTDVESMSVNGKNSSIPIDVRSIPFLKSEPAVGKVKE